MSNDFDNSQGFPLGAEFGTVEELIAAMTPEIYAKLRTAIELGKWQDGSRLSPEQLEQCMEVMILYEARYLPEEQRTGANLPQSCQSKGEEASKLRILNDIELTDPSQGEDA
ncbi:MAG: YeaC family protein [Pseudohongiellaceae bacterium]|jgi:uncharacterized protein YeaC (DUF1315 family)